MGGTQTTPPSSPKRSTSMGGTQTTSPWDNVQDQGVQHQLDCSHIREDLLTHNTASNAGKGKKSKRKSTNEVPPWPGKSSEGFVVPRTDFHSRNLGTGRPTIQCTACGEYSHWRRECPYDNFCTTCNNHDHVTHMCRAPQTPQQSPTICVYCGGMDHNSSQCCNRPWDNREQPCSTQEDLRNQEFQHANGKILGNDNRNIGYQAQNTHGWASQPHVQRSYGEIFGKCQFTSSK